MDLPPVTTHTNLGTIRLAVNIKGERFKNDPSSLGTLYSWTFDGKLVADPLPLSMKRILTGVGHAPPVGLLEAMGSAPI